MGGEGVVLRGTLGLERGQLRVPGVPDCLGTPGMPSAHVAEALLRAHLGHLRIKAVHVHGPLTQQVVTRRGRHGRQVMAPVLREIVDWLALHHAPGTDAGDRVDATPGFDLGALGRKGLRLVRMAGQDGARDRLAVRIAESADDHVARAFLARAMGATGRQCVGRAFHSAPGHSRPKQAGRLRLVSLRQERLL